MIFESEAALLRRAGDVAAGWADNALAPLAIGLTGDLGSGKTTWVRGMLRGLGHAGRVPSPTYTLLEHYPVRGIDVVHVDLYRLTDPDEVENLALRDWLSQPSLWLLVEWPERAPALLERCDLVATLDICGAGEGRRLEWTPHSVSGERAMQRLALDQADSNYSV